MNNTDRICTINGCDIFLQKGDCFTFHDPFITSEGYVLVHDINYDDARGYVVKFSRGSRKGGIQNKDLDKFALNMGYIARYNTESDNGSFKFIPIVSITEKIQLLALWRKIKNSIDRYTKS